MGLDTDAPDDTDADTGSSDQDGDGYSIDAGDCDDEDPAVHPGVAELCNERDDDCDGLLDDADPDLPIQGYEDNDGDGYAGAESRSCDAVPASTDCDEADAAVNPGATETCETAYDDDCDGNTNEEGSVGCIDFAIDADTDGFGSDTDSACLCEATAPYTAAETGDCDDTDPDIYPGGIRCRFSGAYSLDDADLLLPGEDATDAAGQSVAFAGDVDGDGADDLLIGADQESTNGTHSGAAYVVDDPMGGTASLSTAVAKIMGECTDCYLGLDVSGVGDTDGDGYDDILIGEPYLPDGDILSVGAAFLFRGPVVGELYAGGTGGDADARLQGGQGATGFSVAPAGDQDVDGSPDLLVGQPFNSSGSGGDNAGRAYIVSGSVGGSADLDDSVAVLDGESRTNCAGIRLDGGRDVDGDGVYDILIGAYNYNHGETGEGAAYVLYGPVTGDSSLSDAEVKMMGEGSLDYAGWGVGLVSDVDGDGSADVLVGAHNEGSRGEINGAAYLVTSPPDGSSSLADATAKLDGEIRGGYIGYAVSGAGDLDLDGHGDVLVGSWVDLTWLVYGPVSGTMSLDDADASWSGTAGTLAGYDIAGDGDVDADGVPDFLIGAPWDDSAGAGAGIAYLVLGSGL